MEYKFENGSYIKTIGTKEESIRGHRAKIYPCDDWRGDVRTEGIEVKITIPIPFDKPNKNGLIYSKSAVEKAADNLKTGIPIMCSNNNYVDDVIGCTTGKSHITTWDYDNNICKITVDGIVRYGEIEYIINSINEGTIHDFEIVGMGIFK